jgi:hypothetical protein
MFVFLWDGGKKVNRPMGCVHHHNFRATPEDRLKLRRLLTFLTTQNEGLRHSGPHRSALCQLGTAHPFI